MAIAASSAGFVPDRPDLGHRAGGIDLADAAFFAIGPDPGAPHGLPPAAYRALAFAELEDDAVWTRSWLAIGFGSEIPAPGDLLPFTAGHHGIHVQREEDGGLTGRFNKAQHGGCRAVPLQCRTGTKTGCSFTACGHSRDGLPLPAGADGPTPAMHQYLGLRPERLLPVRTYACGPLVMIHLDPAAARPDGLADGLGACTGAAWRVEVAANWKLVAQALAQAPAQTDGQARVRGEGGVSLQLSGALSSGEPAGIRLHFPNLVLITAGSETLAVMLQPTALGRTLLRIGLLGASAPEASLAAWLAEIAARTRAAEAAQAALSGAPDGEARPEANEAGLWLQARIAEAVRARPRHETIPPLYATAQGRGC